MPSTPSPLAFWNASTAAFVLLPRCRPRCRSQIFTLQNWRDSLDTVALTLPYADTGKHAYTPDWSKLPSGQT